MHKALYNCLDLTSLVGGETKEDLRQLLDLASDRDFGSVAALCVYADQVPLLQELQVPAGIKIASVVQFPSGEGTMAALEAEVQLLQSYGVDEIDIVFNYQAYQNGQKDKALEQIAALVKWCPNQCIKVILETGMFKEESILFNAALDVAALGVDFLKTSTGKVPVGATLPAARILLKAIAASKKQLGLKVSGGVSSFEDAKAYYDLAKAHFIDVDSGCFRIGASSLAKVLLHEKIQS